jgi:hypothetical protein
MCEQRLYQGRYRIRYRKRDRRRRNIHFSRYRQKAYIVPKNSDIGPHIEGFYSDIVVKIKSYRKLAPLMSVRISEFTVIPGKNLRYRVRYTRACLPVSRLLPWSGWIARSHPCSSPTCVGLQARTGRASPRDTDSRSESVARDSDGGARLSQDEPSAVQGLESSLSRRH